MNMNLLSPLNFFSDHYLVTILLAFFVIGFGVNIVTYMHQKLDFYIWYFVSILCVLLWAMRTTTETQDHMLYFYAFLLGMVTAFAEILGKFSDEPIKSLRTPHALFYHLLNGAISAFALFALKTFELMPLTNNQEKLKAVLVAGFGAMFVMRSKLFNLKIGGQDVALGPEQLINVFFSFMEDAIDRVRAQSRIEFVRKLRLNEIDFDRLDEYSVSMLMSAQALSMEEMAKCRESIERLRTAKYKDPSLRSFELGFLLLNRMGEDFVAKVFSDLPVSCYTKAALPEQREAGLLDKLAQLRGHAPQGGVYYMAFGTSMCGRAFRERLNWADMEETEFFAHCEPQPCKLKGYRLVFNKPSDPDEKNPARVFGMPNIEPASDSTVEGVLYKLSDATLKFIDRTEIGYVRRHDVEVLVGDKPFKAEVYVAEGVRPGLTPDPDSIQKMLDGARAFQLSKEHISYIESFVTAAPSSETAPPAPDKPADPLVAVANELSAALVAPQTVEAGGNGAHAQTVTP